LKRISSRTAVIAVAAAFAAPAFAQFTETEANDTKTLANIFSPAGAGFTITGNSTGTSTTVPGTTSADYYRLNMFTGALGIYKNRLALTTQGTAFQTLSIRGLTASSAGISTTSDATFQTALTTVSGDMAARTAQWFSFGKGESLYTRVTGTTATTLDYTLTHSVTQVTPTNLGTFAAGTMTLKETGTGDADFWVYDANLDPIPDFNADSGNPNGSGADTLIKTFGPGTYYWAVSYFNAGNNLGAGGDAFQTGNVLDFPGAWASSSSSIAAGGISIVDSLGATVTGNFTPVSGFNTEWYTFTVVPEPGSMLILGAGLAAIAVARRRKQK
jgi:hypothetical protein